MAEQHHEDIEIEEDTREQFITHDDIGTEVPDDGDHPMDEDEDQEDAADNTAGPSRIAENNSVQGFQVHNGSVFCVACHPTEPLAATGGEDDLGYIWDITDSEVIVKLTGHSDSVTCIAWSSDGEMVSTGGMDGKVRLWRRVGRENYRTWEFLTELQGPDEVMFLRWHPKGNVLLAGSNDSTLWLWQLPSGNTMQVFAGHTGAVNCGDFTPDGKKIASACGDNTFIIWDPRSSTPSVKLSSEDQRFDLDGITSLAVNSSSTLAVVGGANGGVRIISLSKGEVVAALAGHKEGESIEAVAFADILGTGSGPGFALTGGTDGKICIWDLSTMKLRTTLVHQDAITNLLVHPSPKPYLVVSGCADGSLRTWDARTGARVREHKGHQAPVLSASLGLHGSVVVSAGDDNTALVFTTEPTDDE
ncbi:hypothetical protein AMATHDRAFT_138564 [Amanita thiersii Skay4041]|uniref:Uncharacterized protein n=1 Tax=Amanita thiersii Skay4041 TaxID=703135 RepID=A0A2A9NX56_9AGAR|nr:hypothetical protein AMATHDRAFT_138564 [Amanita thiersii Skay4041]